MAYRESAKPPEKKVPVLYTMHVCVYLVSGKCVEFECEPMNNGYYQKSTHMKNIHEMFVDKWEPGNHHSRPKMRKGLICFSKNQDHVINLKHVEYYTVEAIQMSSTNK